MNHLLSYCCPGIGKLLANRCLGCSSFLCKFGINVQKWSPKGLNFALNVATTRVLKAFFAFCEFCGIFMKITTKSPRKV